MQTYSDDILISSDAYEAIDPDTYDAMIVAIAADEKKDFDTGEPKPAVQVTFEITQPGEYTGKKITRRFLTPSLHPKAVLGEWWLAINGSLPTGGTHGIRAGLMSKPCRILVEDKTNQSGQTFSNVTKVLGARRKKAAPVAAVADEDDDDEFGSA